MADVVYKPTSDYKPELNTAITKTPLLTGLMMFGTRINNTYFLNDSITRNVAMYTVPSGKTLFITNLSITGVTVNTTSAGYVMCGITNQQVHALYLNPRGETIFINHNYPLPLRILPGEVINLVIIPSIGTISGYLTIIGYEIDSALLPNLI